MSKVQIQAICEHSWFYFKAVEGTYYRCEDCKEVFFDKGSVVTPRAHWVEVFSGEKVGI